MAFKMRGFSGFKQKVDHQKDMEDTVAGPRAKGDTGPASKQAGENVQAQIVQLESMIEDVNTDMENGRISDADGRKRLTQLQRKLKQIRTGK